jgi:outer membrane lipoprotein SlyB
MIATTVTLSSGTKATIQSLLNGAVAGAARTQPVVNPNCAQLTIQADPGNGADIVYTGDGAVSSSNHGSALAAGQSKNYGEGEKNTISLAAIWVTVSGTSDKFNIEAIYQ